MILTGHRTHKKGWKEGGGHRGMVNAWTGAGGGEECWARKDTTPQTGLLTVAAAQSKHEHLQGVRVCIHVAPLCCKQDD